MDLILRFALRTAFIYSLSQEYLGLSGLFTNILSLLSLAELGIGTAITFSLYKPLAENDEKKLAILMRLFKRAYIAVGGSVLVAGTLLTPFLGFFISGMPDVPHIQAIYLLFVVNSGISYFYSYKSSYVIANQKRYVVTNNTYLLNTLCAICQIISLLLFGNYILYLAIQIAFTVISNIRISLIADKMYPVLKAKSNGVLDGDTKHTILENIGAMVFHKIGQVIVFSTDSILLSKMFGLLIVGIYSNYTMIINALEGILSQFFSAIAASIGNLCADSDKRHQNDIFYVVFFLNFWMFSFSTIAVGILMQPFIKVWIGDGYLMTAECVTFIVINFYLKGMRQTTITFDTSYGLMRHYKYMPVPECIINLGMSIVLAYILGPVGILAGTTMSTIFAPLWIEPRTLFKYGLKTSIRKYVKRYIIYALFTGSVFALLNWGLSYFQLAGIQGLIIRLICVLIVPNALICFCFYRTEEFKYMYLLVKKLERAHGR